VPDQSSNAGPGSNITHVARAASLPLRLAAMIYEGVLLFGVVFIVSYALLALAQWTYPLPPARRVVLQALLFVAIGAYFVWCWSRSGQTLALKTWGLKVVTTDSRQPSVARSIARYVLAWHLWLPGALWLLAYPAHAVADVTAFAIGFALLLLPAAADPQRRLLHDRATGTRIVRL
jgi:uncharacterized RDD family membrane protein YckC